METSRGDAETGRYRAHAAAEARALLARLRDNYRQGVLPAFDPDLEGRTVEVIEDVEELQRLCIRRAPGADDEVGWNQEGGMLDLAGETLTIEDCYENTAAYGFEETEFNLPFDAVRLLPESDEDEDDAGEDTAADEDAEDDEAQSELDRLRSLGAD